MALAAEADTPGPSLKHRVFDMIHGTHPGDDTRPFRIFNAAMMALIVANVFAIALASEPSIREAYAPYFWAFDVFSVAVFTVEYFLRLWVCTLDPRYEKPIRGRIAYALTPLALIDLLAIAPFFVELLPFVNMSLDLRFIRSVRLTRMFRVAKLGHYSESAGTLVAVIKDKKEELLVTLFSGGIILVIASFLLYQVEYDEKHATFSSISAAMWWAIETLTTANFSSVTPRSDLGKVIGSIIAVLGICLLALPTGIIASGFVERFTRKRTPRTCPHCGQKITDKDLLSQK
jgi:voltage-gated potassium channel